MKTRIKVSLLFAIVFAGSAYTQEGKIKKANEEFDSYDYIDARKIYLNVVENGYTSAQIFKKLGDTYYFNSEYIEAANWYKKLVEQYPNQVEPKYYYRIAQTLKSTGEYDASKTMMDKYISLSSNSGIAQGYLKNQEGLISLIDFQSNTYEVKNSTIGFASSDFGPSFFDDRIVYSSASINTEGGKVHDWTGLPYLDLYEAEVDENGNLINPIPLKGDINTPYHESSATFTKDGNTIYFTRNNYINGKKKRGKKRLVSLKIYKATKNENGSWGNVKELPFNNDSYSVAHPALSADEKRLYFSSNMEGTLGMSDIWYVDILNTDSYGKPVNLGPEINTEERETFPYVSNQNNLYFSSDGHLGLGGLDIFVISMGNGGNFKEVTNLKSPINTNQDDFGFIINEEKQIGYLSSNRGGNDGSVSDDIYVVWENCNIIINGIVSDVKTGEPIQGSRVILLDGDNNEIFQKVTEKDGSYSFDGLVDCGTQYTVRAGNDEREYEPTEKVIITPKGTQTVSVNLELVPPDCPVNDLGCRLDLQPIYFDFDKHNIRQDAEVELAKILQALKEYPQLSIHIESHTDSRGDDEYNKALSDRRAKATMEWLIGKGIDKERLSAIGYGESQLANKCSNGVDCSKEEHQLNRRSMFIIVDSEK